MKLRRHALIGLALGGLLIGSAAIGQLVVQNQFSGNECWNAGQGPGGPSTGFICLAQMRNGTGLRVISGSGAATTQALTTDSTLYWSGTAPTTWTVTTPVSPFDGEIITLATDTTLTTRVTLVANTGQTLNAAFANQTINGSASVEFQFNLATAKWFELR